jgi:hypothetical protein
MDITDEQRRGWRRRVRFVRRQMIMRLLTDPEIRDVVLDLRPRPPIPRPPPAATGWQILMAFTGKKIDNEEWPGEPRRIAMASPGTPDFLTATPQTTGSLSRTAIGDGDGVYRAFFEMRNITRFAVVDGASASLNPILHDNYLIYDLVESTAEETLYEILRRHDQFILSAPSLVQNDTVFGEPSARNITAGPNGYSGLLTASKGTGFLDNSSPPRLPDKMAITGINRQSDNDIQSVVFYSGNLETGKQDSWRNEDPAETFWSYWGHDFHSNAALQRIGASLQSSPGTSQDAAWEGVVYVLGFA